MHARRAAHQKPLDASQLSAIMSNPDSYQGRVVEFSATVSGQVASGSDRTVLLQIGQQSLAATLPDSLRQAMWIEVDRPIRVLFSVDPHAKDSVRMIAAAPDGEVVAAERQEAEEAASRASMPSRSMAYSRTGDRETVAGVGASDDAAGTYNDDGGHPSAALPARARAVFGAYHAAIRKFNHRLSAEDVDTITNSVLYFSDQNDVDPRLIIAMIIAESDFNIYSRSHTGAMGLGQLMPETARNMGVTDPYDPEQNIAASVRILREHLDKYGGAPKDAGKIPYEQIRLIMAAYNAGPGAVKKYHGVPPYRETQRYVERVASLYREMCGD
jgi:soluble lytic murein transglycosylase-like protein